jgi:hypothetical protein
MTSRDALYAFATNSSPKTQTMHTNDILLTYAKYMIANSALLVCLAIVAFAVGLRLEYTTNTLKR